MAKKANAPVQTEMMAETVVSKEKKAMSTNVKDNPQDARTQAGKRMNNLRNELRKVRNCKGWNLTDAEKRAMAEDIRAQSQRTIDVLMGKGQGGEAPFKF